MDQKVYSPLAVAGAVTIPPNDFADEIAALMKTLMELRQKEIAIKIAEREIEHAIKALTAAGSN